MLTNLYIENLAVIEKATIDFDGGLNVFTGETGAGKSIVIDAVNAILGQRTSRDIIRTGAKKAVIIGTFSGISSEIQKQLEEFGIEAEDELIIQREITPDGKSSARIQSRPVAVSVIKEIGEKLINIHGQHDSQVIMSPEKHIDILDMYAGLETEREEFAQIFSEYTQLFEKLSALNTDEAAKAQRIDLLSFQINEISEANLKEGEEEELSARYTAMKNSAKIIENLSFASESMYGGTEFSGAVDLVAQALESIQTANEYYEPLSEISQRLEAVSIEIADIASEINSFTDDFDFDPGEIERTEARLDEIYRLKRKYGKDITEILSYLEKAKQELDEIEMSDEIKEKLAKQIKDIKEILNKKAGELREKRKAAAERFVSAITKELEFLDMPNVKVQVSFEETSLYKKGTDKIEFLISTNPGEPPKPVSKIASGGELSRIMLSIKNTLADKDNIDTLIFDEIDTGVSGASSQKIGLKLKQVSTDRQVICVTHSAQIAALADNHIRISKSVENGRTYTKVQRLDFEGRKAELARIIGTDKITKLTLDNAEEMLKMAGIS